MKKRFAMVDISIIVNNKQYLLFGKVLCTSSLLQNFCRRQDTEETLRWHARWRLEPGFPRLTKINVHLKNVIHLPAAHGGNVVARK